MRIIVMSDSHGSFDRVRRIVEANKADAQIFLHLGDGVEEFEDVQHMFTSTGLAFMAVKGNNDWGSALPKTRTLVFGGKNILLTHGDLHSVKFGIGELRQAARDAKADVALFGHTHCAEVEYDDGMYLINPGSVLDSTLTPASYLSLDITHQGIVPVIRKL